MAGRHFFYRSKLIKSMQTLQSSLEDYYMKLKERGAGK